MTNQEFVEGRNHTVSHREDTVAVPLEVYHSLIKDRITLGILYDFFINKDCLLNFSDIVRVIFGIQEEKPHA